MPTSPKSLANRWNRLPESVHTEIDTFETELGRFLDEKMPEKVFLEFRLRHGVYGQRQIGVQMLRIKIPLGIVNADQLDVLAEIAEEYSVGIVHITTRQDFQIHYVDILDSPNLMRRLAEAGITTTEACGNTVRNVTACPYAGSCQDEKFDVTPYARAMAYFLLRHPDAQNFGRKFKIAFSGCPERHCGLARMHDIGAVAKIQDIDGKPTHGFEFWVGGGLGAVPHQAKLFSEFVPADEMLPLAQAIARVFAAHGEKQNRARARMKFLVENLGIDEFRSLVLEERAKLQHDPGWAAHEKEIEKYVDEPLKDPSTLNLNDSALSEEFKKWKNVNVETQKQAGYSTVTVFLPLGDLTSDQLRGLANVVRKYTRGTLRTMVQQNFLLRWVADGDLPALHEDLKKIRLEMPLANTIADLTACPGTDSCKLGIASSRGLAGLLHRQFVKDVADGNGITDTNGLPRRDVSVKMSGCFNSCGQHHIANIGFFGTSKRKAGRVAPLFQVIIGGTTQNNASAYGLMVGKVPAHRAPDVIRKLNVLYDSEKQDDEAFETCMGRLGKARISQEIADISDIGDEDVFYYDNRQPWEYVKDVGQGECAGEVVTQSEFLLEEAERLVFEGTLKLEKNDHSGATKDALQAMHKAADGLLTADGLFLTDKYDRTDEFRARFFDPGRFFAQVGEYYLRAVDEDLSKASPERVRKLVEEANLFTEEAHVAYGRMAGLVTGVRGNIKQNVLESGLNPTDRLLKTGLQKFDIKLNVSLADGVDHDTICDRLLAVFGRWRSEEGEDTVDLQDYSHVPQGPGIVLVSKRWVLSVDCRDGQPGLMISTRRNLDGTASERLAGAMRLLLEKGQRLLDEEEMQGAFTPQTGELEIALNDRLLLPNSSEIDDEIRPEVNALLGKLYGDAKCSLEKIGDSKERLAYRVRVEGTNGGIAPLLAKL